MVDLRLSFLFFFDPDGTIFTYSLCACMNVQQCSAYHMVHIMVHGMPTAADRLIRGAFPLLLLLKLPPFGSHTRTHIHACCTSDTCTFKFCFLFFFFTLFLASLREPVQQLLLTIESSGTGRTTWRGESIYLTMPHNPYTPPPDLSTLFSLPRSSSACLYSLLIPRQERVAANNSPEGGMRGSDKGA